MVFALEVIGVAVKALMQVFIIVAVGALMSSMGYVSRETLTNLSKMAYYVFIPCLSFSKICLGIRLDQLADAWPFLIFPGILLLGGWAIGNVFCRLVGVESKALRHSINLTIMFGNYGNLPLPLLDTITREVLPFASDPLATQRTFAYASIFLAMGSVNLWTFGHWYMKSSREIKTVQSSDSLEEGTATSDNNTPQEDEKEIPLDEISTQSPKESSESDVNSGTEQSMDILPEFTNKSETIQPFQSHIPLRIRLWLQARELCQRIYHLPIWVVFTPSTIACIVAVILIAIQPLHSLLYKPIAMAPVNPSSTPGSSPGNYTNPWAPYTSSDSSTIPDDTISLTPSHPPFAFIADAINSLSNITVPISLMLLGSNLYGTVKTQIARHRLSPNAQVLPLKKRVLLGAAFCKLVFFPALFILLIWFLFKLGWLPGDPAIAVTLAVEGSSPPAINLILLAQLQDDQLVVEQLSTILLFEYLVCTFSIFTSIAVALQLFTG